MSPEVSEQIFNAVRYLFVSGIIYCAYHLASGASADKTRRKAVGKCLLYCFGVAAFASLSMGLPSCSDDGDPIRGGCERYEDDGFQPSPEQHGGRFLFVFILLFTPALIGAVNSSKGNFWSGSRDEEDPVEIEMRTLRMKLKYRASSNKRDRDRLIRRYAKLLRTRVQSEQNAVIERKREDGCEQEQQGIAARIVIDTGLEPEVVKSALYRNSAGPD